MVEFVLHKCSQSGPTHSPSRRFYSNFIFDLRLIIRFRLNFRKYQMLIVFEKILTNDDLLHADNCSNFS